MKIREIETLFSSTIKEDLWSEFDSGYKEIYMHSNSNMIRLRLIGPIVKAVRVFVSSSNVIFKSMTEDKMKLVLKGGYQELGAQQSYNNRNQEELIRASNKDYWQTCFLSACVLLDNDSGMENNQMCFICLPKKYLESISSALSLYGENSDDICLSGIKANDIIIRRERVVGQQYHRTYPNRAIPSILRGEVTINISDNQSFLPKPIINKLMIYGINDVKDFYTELNKSNLRKRYGFFYSFRDRKDYSFLNKYLEPLHELKNSEEEEKEYNHIENSPRIERELEGFDLVEFMEIE